MLDLTFLGTSSMYPTKERSQSCVYIQYGPLNILFDCGEGAQRQMRIAGISPMKINKVFVTHWHGDHALGIPGLIQSLSASGRKEALEIIGPQGTSERVHHIIRSFAFDLRYKIITKDIVLKGNKPQKVDEGKDYFVEAMPVKHIIPCLAFAFVKKGYRRINVEYTKKFGLVRHPLLGKLQEGKAITYNGKKIIPAKATFMTPDIRIAYLVDTNYNKSLINIAKEANLLICEATYLEELADKAEGHSHLTAKQAAEIAKKSKAKKLILTHFSQRYADVSPLVAEAKAVFKETEAAKDFMKIKVV